MKKQILALLFALVCFISPSFADTNVYVPEPLKPWVDWVLDQHPDFRCTLMHSTHECIWPGELKLDANESGATFEYRVQVDSVPRPIAVPLPGGDRVWPVNVEVLREGGSSTPIATNVGTDAHVELSGGSYIVRGSFAWSALPEKVLVPSRTALVTLHVLGETIPHPVIEESGELWLRKRYSDAPQEETDSLRIVTSRKLSDGTPFRVTTVLQLTVAGKPREEKLGVVTLAGSRPYQIGVSPGLSYRLEKDYGVTLQVTPGEHTLTIESLFENAPTELQSHASKNANWPDQEFWAWEPDVSFRSVELSGPAQIDPQRTNIPDEWKTLATYTVIPNDQLSLKELSRGEKESAPDQLHLARFVWLNLNGSGYSIRDTFSGQMNQGWRLNATAPSVLEHVAVNGIDQLITQDPEQQSSGVELRNQAINVVADSHIDGATRTLPAVGWDHDVSSLSLALALPPGWSLLTAHGADDLSSSWFSSWTLLDFFLVILVAVSVSKLYAPRWGALALAALIISHGEGDAPYQLWFHLLACAALLKVLPEGGFRKFIGLYNSICLFILGVILIPFCISQIRVGLFPQLAFGGTPNILSTVGGFQFGQQAYPGEVPAATPQAADEVDSYDSSSLVDRKERRMIASAAKSGPGRGYSEAEQKQLTEVDPKAIVQTGRGMPDWNWHVWNLTWSSPVEHKHEISLTLLSPTTNLLLSIIRVALLLGLAGVFLIGTQLVKNIKQLVPISVLLLCTMVRPAVADSLPNKELLDELEKRLLASGCQGDCVSTNQLDFSVGDTTLELKATVSARATSAWPIPGPVSQFEPSDITLDGKPTASLRRDESGFIWARIPEGVHTLVVHGSLRSKNTVTFSFALQPGFVSAHALGGTAMLWNIDGINEQGGVTGSLQLSRKPEAKSAKAQQSANPEDSDQALPAWYTVTRNISIGLVWSVETTVFRWGSEQRSNIVKLPLLSGEKVTSGGFKVENGHIEAVFGRGENTISWTSNLTEVPSLSVAAPRDSEFTENWLLSCSSVWRCSAEGLVPTQTISEGQHQIVWKPWPGEQVTIAVKKPLSTEGRSLTTQKVLTNFRPGIRILEGDISVDIKSTRGGFEDLELPDGAELQKVTANGAQIAVRPDGRVVHLPISAGSQQFVLSWQQPWEHSVFERMPDLKLKSGAANVTTTVALPEERWILFTGGPKWGPAVLFWGTLLVMIMFGIILGRTNFSPLGTKQWILLALGLASVSPEAMLVPVFWFFINHRRKNNPSEGRWRFNFQQIFIAIVAMTTMSVLYYAVQAGLLMEPNMQVQGNNSYNSLLRWYVDFSDSALPQPWVVTVPMWVYRILMLLWSSWLVFALLSWLRWAWSCFSHGGLWRRKTKLATPAAS